jgi:hypothetical protein
MATQTCLPRARKNQLIIKEVGSEVLVFDQGRNKALCLNRTSAIVWNSCDGATTVQRMSRKLEEQLQTPVDESVVWFALQSLEKDGLLDDMPAVPPMMASMTRSEMFRKLGAVAAIAIPVIAVLAPPSAKAATASGPSSSPPK